MGSQGDADMGLPAAAESDWVRGEWSERVSAGKSKVAPLLRV